MLSAPWRRRKKSPPLPASSSRRGRESGRVTDHGRLSILVKDLRRKTAAGESPPSFLPNPDQTRSRQGTNFQSDVATWRGTGDTSLVRKNKRSHGVSECFPMLAPTHPGLAQKSDHGAAAPRGVIALHRADCAAAGRVRMSNYQFGACRPRNTKVVVSFFPPRKKRKALGRKNNSRYEKFSSRQQMAGNGAAAEIPPRPGGTQKFLRPTPIYLRSRKSWFLAVHHLLCDFCDVFQKMTPD